MRREVGVNWPITHVLCLFPTLQSFIERDMKIPKPVSFGNENLFSVPVSISFHIIQSHYCVTGNTLDKSSASMLPCEASICARGVFNWVGEWRQERNQYILHGGGSAPSEQRNSQSFFFGF